jgi:hypothetical protein
MDTVRSFFKKQSKNRNDFKWCIDGEVIIVKTKKKIFYKNWNLFK